MTPSRSLPDAPPAVASALQKEPCGSRELSICRLNEGPTGVPGGVGLTAYTPFVPPERAYTAVGNHSDPPPAAK